MNKLYINSLFIFILACPLAAFSDPKQAPPETRPPEMPNPCTNFGRALCTYYIEILAISRVYKEDIKKISSLLNSLEEKEAKISNLMKLCTEKNPISCSELNKLQSKLMKSQNNTVQPIARNQYLTE